MALNLSGYSIAWVRPALVTEHYYLPKDGKVWVKMEFDMGESSQRADMKFALTPDEELQVLGLLETMMQERMALPLAMEGRGNGSET